MHAHSLPHESIVQQLADRYPFIFLPWHLAQGKFRAPEEKVLKIKDTFEDAEYRVSGELIARLVHYEDFPIVEIFTQDRALKAKAQAHLTARYFMQLYLKYIQFLPLAARFRSGLYLTDPMQFTNAEIRRRQLDFGYMDVELHHMLQEFNACIAEHNQSVSSVLHFQYFTMDDLKALIALCDVYKGIGGCSAAVGTQTLSDGREVSHLIRNLEWSSFNILGNYSLGTLTRTRNTEADKPEAVISIGFAPGILGLSMANDRGLVITLNEATTMESKRENNQQDGTPQFFLIRRLVENCSTVAEVKRYLEHYRPATSHILTVMDAEGSSGVFEILPNKGPYADKLYRFRGTDRACPESCYGASMQVVTNHFLDDRGDAVEGAHPDSVGRYLDMCTSVAWDESPVDIAKSASVKDTIQTLIFTRDKNQFTLDLKVANSNSARTPEQYTHINLGDRFAAFLKTSLELEDTHSANREVDCSLIKLMQLSQQLGPRHPGLSHALSQLYSALTLALSKTRIQAATLSETQIERIAYSTAEVVNKVLSANIDLVAAEKLIKDHENLLKSVCPDSYLAVITELGWGAIECSLLGVLINNGRMLAGMVFGGDKSVYETPGLTTFNHQVVTSLRHLVKENDGLTAVFEEKSGTGTTSLTLRPVS